MEETYPAFSEQGDWIEEALEARLAATGALNPDEIASITELVAATYQRALQLRYVIEALAAGDEPTPRKLATGLEDVEALLGRLATWHATTRDKLYHAAQRVRAGRR